MKISSSQILLCSLIMITGSYSTIGYAEEDLLSEEPKTVIQDPWEKFNRSIFKFNDNIDKYIAKPVAKTYNRLLPNFALKGIHNVFTNALVGNVLLNDLLQANFYQTTSDSWRFFINTTLGIGGLFDIASNMGLPPNSEKFGTTLAKWGYQNSNYLVLPFWGPSTVCDTIGLPVDFYSSFYPWIADTPDRFILEAWGIVDTRAQYLRFSNLYETMSFDSYILMRNAYLQRRDYAIQNSHEKNNPYSKTDPVLQDTYETSQYLAE